MMMHILIVFSSFVLMSHMVCSLGFTSITGLATSVVNQFRKKRTPTPAESKSFADSDIDSMPQIKSSLQCIKGASQIVVLRVSDNSTNATFASNCTAAGNRVAVAYTGSSTTDNGNSLQVPLNAYKI